MKLATIFLVAVTVFTGLLQQSSAAPQWGQGGGLIGNLVTGVKDIVRNILEDVKVLLNKILGNDITALLAWIGDLVRITTTLPKEDKAKVTDLITEVKLLVKQLIALVKDLLNNADELTAETIEKARALLAKLVKEIKALLKEVLLIIEAILRNGGKNVTDVVHSAKIIIGKITKTLDNIESIIIEILDDLHAKSKDDAGHTSEVFKEKIAGLMEQCDAERADLGETMEELSGTVTDDEKDDFDKLVNVFIIINRDVEQLHSYIRESMDDIHQLLKCIPDIKNIIARIIDAIGLLDKMKDVPKIAIMKEKMEHIIQLGNEGVKLISEYK